MLVLAMTITLGISGWPAPVRLRVEGLEQLPQQPVVLSETLPRFSFSHGQIAAGAPPRGLGQSAYQLTVQCAEAVVWDSGVVNTTSR